MAGVNKASGQTGRKIARYKKNRRAVHASTPARPSYTVPTLVGTGSGPGSGTGPGNVLTVNFDQIVSVQTQHNAPLPGWVDVSRTPNLTVVSVAQVTSTQVALTFDGTVVPGDVIQIPDEDVSIRTSLAGFVQPGVYTAP
jgi:hypothetical protein